MQKAASTLRNRVAPAVGWIALHRSTRSRANATVSAERNTWRHGLAWTRCASWPQRILRIVYSPTGVPAGALVDAKSGIHPTQPGSTSRRVDRASPIHAGRR